MPITPTEKIWMDGELVDWADAKVHVLTHPMHYGSGVFEGIRAYPTSSGVAVFRLGDHIRRREKYSGIRPSIMNSTGRGPAETIQTTEGKCPMAVEIPPERLTSMALSDSHALPCRSASPIWQSTASLMSGSIWTVVVEPSRAEMST